METLLLLLLIMLFIWFASRQHGQQRDTHEALQHLHDEVRLLREQLAKQPPPTSSPIAAAAKPAAAKASAEALNQPLTPAPAPPAPEPAPQGQPAVVPEPASIYEEATDLYVEEAPAAPPKPSFWQRNPDWEKFIGENLINKLGIAILVLGIGFFVKFAIDQDWINEAGRVAIGILAGGVLLGVAHRLRRQYQAFSSVLIGGGLAVLYFTIAIAFHQYALFSQTVAFMLMVGITGFTIFLALAYDRMELAVLALVGGFASPFMVSTGEGSYVSLFTFILILNVGILVLAYFKKWNLLHLIAYLFTVLLYGGWLGARVVGAADPPYLGALVFGTLFYLVFFLMNIIHNLKTERRFTAPEFMMLLSNTFFYYAAGMFVLHYMAGGIYKGAFTVVLAAFNLVFAYMLYRNQKADRNLVYLLIGLVLTFLSLTAPVQLEGNYITLFWALEAVLLLWFSQQSGIKLIRTASVAVLGLMLLSLLLDWRFYTTTAETEALRVVFNRIFVTGAVGVAALIATNRLLRQEQGQMIPSLLQAGVYKVAVKVLLLAVLYLVLLLELNYQLKMAHVSPGAYGFVLATYNYAYLLGLMTWAVRQPNASVKKAAAAAAAGAAVYLLVLQPLAVDSRDGYVQGDAGTGFWWHYGPLLLVLAVLALLLVLVWQLYGRKHLIGKLSLWFASFIAVFLASAELEHLALLASYSAGNPLEAQLSQIRKIGFPLLWGLSSFVLMLIGMRRKLKTLRIVSLTLFFLTLVKLFLFDIQGISEGGKIAAFICLGVLLLIVSFMYQRLKNLILEDEIPLPEQPATDDAL